MTETTEESEFCTVLYAAQRSGIALKTWYQGGAGTGSVPRIRFGRSIRLLRKDVDEFISERIKAHPVRAVETAEAVAETKNR